MERSLLFQNMVLIQSTSDDRAVQIIDNQYIPNAVESTPVKIVQSVYVDAHLQRPALRFWRSESTVGALINQHPPVFQKGPDTELQTVVAVFL